MGSKQIENTPEGRDDAFGHIVAVVTLGEGLSVTVPPGQDQPFTILWGADAYSNGTEGLKADGIYFSVEEYHAVLQVIRAFKTALASPNEDVAMERSTDLGAALNRLSETLGERWGLEGGQDAADR